MLLVLHLIVSVILTVILFPFFNFYSLIVIISGFFVDFDHIVFYLIKFKGFKFKKMYSYFRDITIKKDLKKYKKVWRVFHSIEFIILIIILSFFHKIFLVFLIGTALHITMDIIPEYPRFKTLKTFSLIWHIKNAKKQNKE